MDLLKYIILSRCAFMGQYEMGPRLPGGCYVSGRCGPSENEGKLVGAITKHSELSELRHGQFCGKQHIC